MGKKKFILELRIKNYLRMNLSARVAEFHEHYPLYQRFISPH